MKPSTSTPTRLDFDIAKGMAEAIQKREPGECPISIMARWVNAIREDASAQSAKSADASGGRT